MDLERMLRNASNSGSDLLGQLQRTGGRRGNDDLLGALGTFGAGIIVGAGLALLLAPKPGRQLRREIGEKVGQAFDRGEGPRVDAT